MMKFDYRVACFTLFMGLAAVCCLAALIALMEGAYALAVVCALGTALLAAISAGCSGDVEG